MDRPEQTVQTPNEAIETIESEDQQATLQEGDWVVGIYNADWYIGKVIEIDNEDDEVHIDFGAGRQIRKCI